MGSRAVPLEFEEFGDEQQPDIALAVSTLIHNFSLFDCMLSFTVCLSNPVSAAEQQQAWSDILQLSQGIWW